MVLDYNFIYSLKGILILMTIEWTGFHANISATGINRNNSK